MRAFKYFAVFFVLLMATLQGCDSTSTIEDPNDSYFVKFFGGEGDQLGVDLVVLPDGSTILFGTTQPTGKLTQWYIVRADPKGNLVWEREFGKSGEIEEARAIELTNDNRIVAVGNYKLTPTGDRDIRIMTLGLDGVPLDSAFINVHDVLGNPTTADENALSVTQTNDGFIIAGSTTYLFNKAPITGRVDLHDALKIRLYDDLTVYPNTWLQTYGYYADDVSQKIFQLPNGQFYVFGYTNKDFPGNSTVNYNFWIYSLSATGDFNNQELTPPPGVPGDDEKLSSVVSAPAASGSGYFLGGITSTGGALDIYVTKLRSSLTFNSTDYQFQKPLSLRLGTNVAGNTSVFASAFTPSFYVLANENSFNNQNWVLTKVNSDGTLLWALPIIFGGEGLDTVGEIQELPDGDIVMIGTMRTGKPDAGEFKMTLIKVNQDGKFLK